jgi:NTP pyrophosphatase (non-canonical NTP hydrolase)
MLKKFIRKIFSYSYFSNLYVDPVNANITDDAVREEEWFGVPVEDTEPKGHCLPTPAQVERLDILIEECSEVIKAITSIKRFGFESYNPTLLVSDSNRDDLARELGDLTNAIAMLTEAGDVDPMMVINRAEKKAAEIGKWMQHN